LIPANIADRPDSENGKGAVDAMNEDENAFTANPDADERAAAFQEPRFDEEGSSSSDEIPTISDEMLHRDRVDFEAGMKVFPAITLALMLACAAVYMRQLWIGGLDNLGRVVATGALERDRVQAGELWRLISSGFMHANAEHLIGNLVMLYVLGMACEHAFGRGPFLFLYLAGCASGSLLAMTSAQPMVGASGAILGLAGALITMIGSHRRKIELRDHRVSIVLAVWAVYTLFLGAFNPIVSNSAHLGGLLGGSILGLLLGPVILEEGPNTDKRLIPKLETGVAVLVLASAAFLFLPHLR
jgi:rhomboid protease GluP